MAFLRTAKLLFSVYALFAFASCKKDSNNDTDTPPGSSDSEYFISFSLDGAAQKYVNNAEGNMNVVDAGGKYTFSGAALKMPNIAGSNNTALIISSATEIKTNTTYVNYTTSATGYERAAFATVSYITDDGIAFLSWGDEFSGTGIVSDTKITFTEITNTNLRGTFSGTSYKSISGDAEKHVLTGGEFNLKRK